MRSTESGSAPRLLDPSTWGTGAVARATLRLCLVATVIAAGVEAILLVAGGLALADHLIIAGMIVGSASGAALAARGQARAAAVLVIGTLWGAALTSVMVHGVPATALPTLTVAVVLAALWSGPRLAIVLIAVSSVALTVASGVLGPLLPPPVAIPPMANLILIVGQFVFIGTLVAFLGRVLGEVREQLQTQDDRLLRTTQELQASRTAKDVTEARYTELVQALPDIVFLLEPDGTIAEVNATVERVLGVPPSTITGTRLGQYGLLDPDEAPHVFAALQQVFRGEEVPPLTLRVRHQSGAYRWMEATTRLVYAAAGHPQVLAIVRDITDRRDAEQSRRVLAQAVEWAQGAMSTADTEGVLTYVNDAFVRMWGYQDATQCVGRHALEFWKDKDAAIAVISAVKEDQHFVRGTLTGLRADGSTFEAELAANVIFDDGGRMIGMMGSFADVTARLEAERALKDREAKLRRASRIARLGGWEVDLERNVLIWDDEVKRIHEVPADFEPNVEQAISFYAPESRPVIEAAFTRLVATGEPYNLELNVRTATGRVIRVRAQGEAEYRDGRVVKVFGVFQDISELHQAAERLRAAEERNRAIVESAADLIVLLAADGTVLFGSPSSERILGVRPEEALGRNFTSWLHPEDVPTGQREFARLVGTPGGESTTLLRFRHTDGSWRRLETVGRNMLDVPGVQAIFTMGRDVTERERLEEHLRETQKLESLGRLAGGVAHDFNNLLTAILGYAEDIALNQPDSSVAEDAQEIMRAAGRARDLTKQLLTFARRQVTMPRDLDVREQVTGLRRFLERLLGEDVRLVVELAEDTGAVRMDPSHFEQVILNLAANARDAMPAGGTLTIEARGETLTGAAADARRLPPGAYVRLEIRDTGSGMTPEVAARIFEPFFTTKELGKGTGLGLATVYGIVRQVGGQIDVASTVGSGTTFVLHLPRVELPTGAAPTDVGASQEPRGGNEAILLVEDEAAVRGYAQRILRDWGYEVAVAADAAEAEALAHARGRPFDLIITDVVMPDVSGPALVQRLTEAWGPVPVLYVSGYTEERLADERLDERRRYLPKPYGRQDLLSQVRVLLDAGRPKSVHSSAD